MDSSSEETQVRIVSRDQREIDWEELGIAKVNPSLFKTFVGYPMKFHFKVDNETMKRNYEQLICKFGGWVIYDYLLMDSTTALMVEDDRGVLYKREAFKVSYIIDCIQSNSLLDISEYQHNKYSFRNEKYMEIVYMQKGAFAGEEVDAHMYDSFEEDVAPNNIIPKKNVPRSWNGLFSHHEKETILKFIVINKSFSGLGGNLIWKKMEKHNICPKRTWQSMKNHFLKKLIYELDDFEFLTDKQKKQIRRE